METWISDYLLSLNGVTMDFKEEWQAKRYFLAGKMFALMGKDKSGEKILTLKLVPSLGQMLRLESSDVVPGYYMNKEHWNSIYYHRKKIEREKLKWIMDQGYEAAFGALSKKKQKELV